MINNFLGIDISKERFDVFLSFISKKGKRETRKRSFKNEDSGFQGLLGFLQKHNVEEVKACMESTGCYGEALAEFLHNAGHFVSVVNPYCIKCYARSKLVRQKNDQTDAEIIADYCQRQEPSRWTPPSSEKKKLKHLYRCLAALKDELVLVNNHLEKKERLPKEVANAWENLAMNIEQEIKIIRNSIRELLKQHKELLEDFQLLLTIPGIGEESAIAILAEIPDIKAFINARQLAAYAGTIPRNITSGSSVHAKPRLSKTGSRTLCKAIYFPAIVAKNHNPIIMTFCERLKEKGKHNMAIVGAAMRKLLHIVFGVLSSRKAFDPDHINNYRTRKLTEGLVL
ncbi:Transposase IS116/IS110/IS902 family protein [Wolbachia endosymbiont of Cylisticus convexus]|uniref:IS110 family transposase n=1 Tax=Wolbachia endosymbiont of Cylisticus convexus TaxID=118728 RepID=UPI000DF6FFF2|nr:IS110 family transposase [Wolbachia endosymbiont of Cylisticus convexus]RDD34046.1 Transposase IS116/IS110/IS902 family protein [Wolbachia endosymbiont of Cylisticus convexus]